MWNLPFECIKSEEIPFQAKDPTQCFIKQLHNILEGSKYSTQKIKLSRLKRIDIITGGDNGAGAFRCPICIVLKFNDGDTTYLQGDCNIAHINIRQNCNNEEIQEKEDWITRG